MHLQPIALHCILPPHILRRIVEHGDDQQRQWAMHSLGLSERFRGKREALGNLGFAAAVPAGEKRRTIYDGRHAEDLPGALMRGEGDATSKDPAVNEAYDGAGATYDLYEKVYERKSIDDRGLRLDSTVHYGSNYDNAFWDGKQMVYGDGDGKLFNRFTVSIDVIGHELTHGVTQYEAGLVYKDQAGALNESMSDVFGSLVKQYKKKHKAEKADWLIGKGLLTTKVKGVALRSMKAPGTAYDDPVLGKDPQPAHMKNYLKTSDDNGGVHINSGIPNHAFYLVAMELGGYAWEKAGADLVCDLARSAPIEREFSASRRSDVSCGRRALRKRQPRTRGCANGMERRRHRRQIKLSGTRSAEKPCWAVSSLS